MSEELKSNLITHLEDLLHFWWEEYRSEKKNGQSHREFAAAALRNYRRVKRDHNALGAV